MLRNINFMSILTIMTWLMFFGLFPISIYWLRRAWLIGVRKDYSFVALKKGVPPKNPKKYAKYSFLVNLIAGSIFVIVIILIAAAVIYYDQWTAIIGVTLWMKLFTDFIISRHAHSTRRKR